MSAEPHGSPVLADLEAIPLSTGTPPLHEWFVRRAARDPERLALSFGDRSWTFAELADWAGRFASDLARRGVSAGDRIGYLAENHPSYFVTVLAASWLGAATVPMNHRWTAEELDGALTDAPCAGVVVGPGQRATLERCAAAAGGFVLLTESSLDGETVEDAAAGCVPAPMARVAPDRPLMLMFTSGSTGTPKGAVITHEVLWAGAVNCLLDFDFRRDDVLPVLSPVSHMAVWPWTAATWLKGGRIVLERAFDAGRFLELVETEKVTSFGAVTPLLGMIASHPDFDVSDLSSLRWISVGGSPLSPAVRDRFRARGVEICACYGLTEAAAMAAVDPPELRYVDDHSSGRPLLFTDFKVAPLEDAGGPDGPGEICIRGRNVITGYWGGRGGVDDNGWCHTGDIGYFDERGLLHLVDRLKDMVKTGGENVASAEVEAVLREHPAVAEVAVVGVPHDVWGELVSAVVVLNPGHELSLEELREFAAGSLARFKLPRALSVLDAMPRNSVGKISKPDLRLLLVAGRTDGPPTSGPGEGGRA